MSNRRRYFWRPDEPPEAMIPPTRIRHRPEPPETPEERARSIQLGLRMESVFLSHQLGLEIQAACPVRLPLDQAQREGLEALRSLNKGKGRARATRDLPSSAVATLDGAYDDLLARCVCSHCEVRHECGSSRRRRNANQMLD